MFEAPPPPGPRESKHGTPSFWLILGSALVSLLIVCNYRKVDAPAVRVYDPAVDRACRVLYALSSLWLLALYLRRELPAGVGQVSTAAVAWLAAGFSIWAIYHAGAEALKWCAGLIGAGV